MLRLLSLEIRDPPSKRAADSRGFLLELGGKKKKAEMLPKEQVSSPAGAEHQQCRSRAGSSLGSGLGGEQHPAPPDTPDTSCPSAGLGLFFHAGRLERPVLISHGGYGSCFKPRPRQQQGWS